MIDSYLSEIVNAALDKNDENFHTLAYDCVGRTLLENYSHQKNAALKERIMVMLLRNRCFLTMKLLSRVYYSYFIFAIAKKFMKDSN